jgi:hypothetical protein
MRRRSLLTFERCSIDGMCTYFGAAYTTLDDLSRKSDLRRKLDCVLFTVPLIQTSISSTASRTAFRISELLSATGRDAI